MVSIDISADRLIGFFIFYGVYVCGVHVCVHQSFLFSL